MMNTLAVLQPLSGLCATSTEPQFPWYAIRVRSNFEQTVSHALEGKGYKSYLPVYRKRSRQSHRVRNLDLPLFPGYVFCRIDLAWRLPVLTTPGVVNIVGFGSTFVPVSEREMEAVQSVIRSGLPSLPWPYLREGDPIRITKGALKGVEGILIREKQEYRVVVSITLLQRAVAVEVDRETSSN